MDGHEPEMGDTSFEDRIDAGIDFDPLDEPPYLLLERGDGRRLTVHTFPADRARDDLRGPLVIGTSDGNRNGGHAASACRKYRGVPGKQSIDRKRCGIILGGVEHHLNHAFDIGSAGTSPAMSIHRRSAITARALAEKFSASANFHRANRGSRGKRLN